MLERKSRVSGTLLYQDSALQESTTRAYQWAQLPLSSSSQDEITSIHLNYLIPAFSGLYLCTHPEVLIAFYY